MIKNHQASKQQRGDQCLKRAIKDVKEKDF